MKIKTKKNFKKIRERRSGRKISSYKNKKKYEERNATEDVYMVFSTFKSKYI